MAVRIQNENEKISNRFKFDALQYKMLIVFFPCHLLEVTRKVRQGCLHDILLISQFILQKMTQLDKFNLKGQLYNKYIIYINVNVDDLK